MSAPAEHFEPEAERAERRELARSMAAAMPPLTADQIRELRRLLTTTGAPTPGGGGRDPDE